MKPEWLDRKFLEKVLQNGKEDIKIAIVNFSISPATSAGDNYSSCLYRVAVGYKTEDQQSDHLVNTSLIIKTPPSSGMFQELTTESDLWTVEPLLYNTLLPRIFKKVNSEFAPRSFVCPFNNGLVLQDLKPLGYIVRDRFQQLDFPHCKMVIEMFSKLHAGSVACSHEDPYVIQSIGKESFFQKNGPFKRRMKVWMEASFRQCANTLKEFSGHDKIVELVKHKADTIWESVMNMCYPKSNCLSVLTHGDCWTNNLLFKYSSDGQLIDLKVVDFQMARLGTPVFDLILFIWCSANGEVLEKRHQELYEIYIESLNQTLENLGCSEKFTLEQLQEDLRSNRDWILLSVGFFLPFYLCQSEDAIDLGSLTLEELQSIETDPRFPKMFNNRHFKQAIQAISKQLLSSGLF